MSVLTNDVPPTSGKAVTVQTLAGDNVSLVYSVIEASDLLVSNLADGSINQAYPQELQPRDRTSLQSKLQVNRIATDLQPENLSDSDTSADGSPIIGHDRVVESGNGRVMGIIRAYSAGQADDYAAWITSNAELYGLDPDDIAQMSQPVLVRVRTSNIDRAQFARDSNAPNSVPDKSAMLERALSTGDLAAKLQKKQRQDSLKLLAACHSLTDIVQVLNALQHKNGDGAEHGGYYYAVAVNKAIQNLMTTTPDNKAALASYQVLTKSLIGAKVSDSYSTTFSWDSRTDFREVLGLNPNIKPADWSMWFSNGAIWQTAPLLKAYFEADEKDRPEIARQIMPIWSKLSGKKTFSFGFIRAMTKIGASAGVTMRAGQLYNQVLSDALRSNVSLISDDDAKSEMDTSSLAGRDAMESLDIISKASEAKETLRKGAVELASLLKGALSQQQISEAIRFSPAIRAMADYDPDKDAVFGARHSTMSSFLRMMEYRSTQATLEKISRVDPIVADSLNNFYVDYKRAAGAINSALNEHVSSIIDKSSTTDEQAAQWVSTLNISKAAIKSFDARYGKNSIQNELKKIYRLTNGKIHTLNTINFKSRQRAYANQATGEVMLSDTNDLSVLWHEVGHHFEFSDPNRLLKAKHFLRKRMGENEQYMTIEGTKDERAIRDSLSESYIGRVYGDRTINGTDATEVFSMAFQCVMDTNYCGNSVMNNDEMLDFVLGEISKVHN